MSKAPVEAICTADLHLSLRPPLARSVEPDWLEAQRRPLRELADLQEEYKDAVLIYAGDIFDKPNPSAELLNFALEYLPRGYAVPGQHDLPNHSWKELKRSGFYTLWAAGSLHLLAPNLPTEPTPHPLRLFGYPWGFKVEPKEVESCLPLDVAVIHDTIWTKETGFKGADPGKLLKRYVKRLEGFEVAVFGDNHVPFTWRREDPPLTVVNCGSLQRRTIAQRDYRPAAWLLRSDGTVEPHYLDVSKDRMLEPEDWAREAGKDGSVVTELVEELAGLTDASVDFAEQLRQAVGGKGVAEGIRRLVLTALEGVE